MAIKAIKLLKHPTNSDPTLNSPKKPFRRMTLLAIRLLMQYCTNMGNLTSISSLCINYKMAFKFHHLTMNTRRSPSRVHRLWQVNLLMSLTWTLWWPIFDQQVVIQNVFFHWNQYQKISYKVDLRLIITIAMCSRRKIYHCCQKTFGFTSNSIKKWKLFCFSCSQTVWNQFVENQFVESSLQKSEVQFVEFFSTNWILQNGILQTG